MLSTEKRGAEGWRRALLIALGSFAVQLLLAQLTESYPYDAACFAAWAQRIADIGPAGFYAADYFCDYPPAYLLALWLPGKLLNSSLFSGEALSRMVLAFLPALAGAALGPVCYHIGRRNGLAEGAALRVAAAAAFCPAILYDTGVWGQIDSVFALAMLGCFALLEEKRYVPGALCYGLALAVKPQAFLAGPALALCFLWPLIREKGRARLHALQNAALGAAAALAPPLLCGLPFWGFAGLWDGLAEKYFTTASSYPYAAVNAANLIAFWGGEWVPQTNAMPGLPLSWQQAGTALLLLLSAGTVYGAYRAEKSGRFSPLLLAAFYSIGVFTLSHRMHERYLIFGAVLLFGAAARFGHKKLLALAGGFSLTSLLNMALVYGTVGTDDEFLTSAMNSLMLRAVGLGETLLFLALAAVCWQIAAGDALEPAPQPGGARPLRRRAAKAAAPGGGTGQPAWTRREALALAGLTAAAAAVSFAYLGDRTAPQRPLDENGAQATLTVSVSGAAAELWVYPGISSDNAGSLTVRDAAGQIVATLQLGWGTSFTWQRITLAGGTEYTVTLADAQVMELAFRDADGGLLGVSGEAADTALFDEQALVPQQISQLNSFYFDEIYHARTGYETLHGMTLGETTHPPLGKDLIALGIALFGMTGFGWRFSGTLFGVLLVPLLYVFVRRLTARRQAAGFAAAVLALDFMRFSQSRLATIDTYAVFFILLAAYGMIWYCQSVRVRGVAGSIGPMALSGAAFGFGCASKWTGIYAGAGLAVLYFWALAVRVRQLRAPAADAPAPDAAPARRAVRREVWAALAGGVVFFVLIPFAIYLASYAPCWLQDHSFGLSDWWGCQTYMYWYHANLDATHPFASSWYSWLLDLRPVWYYMGSGLRAGQYASIAGFVGPVAALAGGAAWLHLAKKQMVGDGSPAGAALIVLLLSSLLPWVLVTRCTFLYHYFPCVPFLIAALALVLSQWAEKRPRAARRTACGLLGAAAVLFVWFYPALSGLPVGRGWAASLLWLPSWGFYIL